MKLSTKDRDNDRDSSRFCAQSFKGAWWYKHCANSNLNGLYLHGIHRSGGIGVNWDSGAGIITPCRKLR